MDSPGKLTGVSTEALGSNTTLELDRVKGITCRKIESYVERTELRTSKVEPSYVRI
jgi:hypothetical protein